MLVERVHEDPIGANRRFSSKSANLKALNTESNLQELIKSVVKSQLEVLNA
jgi:hypothetical protein